MPTLNQIRITDPVLTNFGLSYRQKGVVDVHDEFFPPFSTNGQETGRYSIYDANRLFRRFDTKRADGGEAAAIEWTLTSATFSLNAWALKAPLTDRQRAQALNPIRLEQGRVEMVTNGLAMDREFLARDIVFLSTFTPEKTCSPLWNAANSKVLTDVVSAFQGFVKLNAIEPNLLVIPPRIWAIFMDATVTDTVGWILHERLKYTMATTGKNITPELVGQLFGFSGKVVIPNRVFSTQAMTNLARGGGGIQGGAFVWDLYSDDSTPATSIIFAYVDPSAAEDMLTYGWCFIAKDYEVKRYREEHLEKEWYEAGRIEERVVIASSCLYRVKVM